MTIPPVVERSHGVGTSSPARGSHRPPEGLVAVSVLIMHARWNGLSTHQLALLQDLVELERAVEGCCSCTSRQDGSSLLVTAVWDREGSMLAFTLGPMARTRAAALLDEPQVALFSVPEQFALAYRRPATAAVPVPRAVPAPAGQLVR